MRINIPQRAGLSALALVTLTMMAGTASAQSAEYRRGYDQGFRDGAEATAAQGQSGRMQGRLHIESAMYGTRDASCDVRDALQQSAARRRYLEIRVNNDLCGDPSPGRPKRLMVSYRCGDGAEMRADGREGSMMALSCR
ncbi:hypothetical protein BH11PSE11_BH11PSE11_23010 [soil metagenome]